MRIELDPADLRPIVESVVAEVVATLSRSPVASGDRLAYLEGEAASLLGVRPSVLRDARLAGEINATRIGGRWGYERSELLAYLAKSRLN